MLRPYWLRFYLVTCLALPGLAVSALGQALVRQVNLYELSRRAGVIVHGRIVEVRVEGHPDYRNVPTLVVALSVIENVRGAKGKRVMFRQYAPAARLRSGHGATQAGKYSTAEYQMGQELVLFLYPESQYGLTSPVGAGQGRFRVLREASGGALIVNEAGNRGLFENVATSAKQSGVSLSGVEQRMMLARPGSPVELSTFLGLVKRLGGGGQP
jgi:hypothetical protein